MKSIGFLKSTKRNEKRRALLPEQVGLIKNKEFLFFEKGYGDVLGYSDDDYIAHGARILSKEQILSMDVICDPKIGDSNYLDKLKSGQLIFGWVHAAQNRELTDFLLDRGINALAWEAMNDENHHVFWKNNELAGKAAVLHAFTFFGKLPAECNIALLGRGNVAMGALKTLTGLGADVVTYNKRTEHLLRRDLEEYDIFVNGILWDIKRSDHILYKEDLKRLKKPAMIIDVSCDHAGAIESSCPTDIVNPVYMSDGVLHYVVDHTPSILFHSASRIIGEQLVKYIDFIIEDRIEDSPVLKDAVVIKDGEVLYQRIIDLQGR